MNTIKTIYTETKSSLFDYRPNFGMVVFQVVAFIISLLVWIKVIEQNNIFVYSVTNYFPLQVFLLIFLIHITLSVYAYKKDKNISILLLGASTFYIIIVITIESLYLIYK